MSETTFSQFRQNVKAYYKRIIKSSIEPQVLNIFHKYESFPMTSSVSDSLRTELKQLMNHYIDTCGMDSYTVYEAYNEIASEYNNNNNISK